MIQSTKVVTATEMARLEECALASGSTSLAFMEQAGSQIANVAKGLGQRVVLLVGKGNKGGDAYVAGIQLMKWGVEVRACPLFPKEECSELNRYFSLLFTGPVDDSLDFSHDDLIIDGLLGTGFHGQVDGRLREVIEAANASKKPILAIDIPSGLNGSTGEVGGVAIQATRTVTLGLAKTGLFVREGWKHTGKLSVADFGLPESVVQDAKVDFLLPTIDAMELPPMERTHHKYERGFVAGFGGSEKYKGAIKLSARAAMHSGAGIVKLFSSEEIGPVEDEILSEVWKAKAWHEALEKAQAVFMGPGLGRSAHAKQLFEPALKQVHQPCVLDADALFFLNECAVWPKQCVLTPHLGELLHLLDVEAFDQDELFRRCTALVEEKQCVLVLKGAPTFVFSPGSKPFISIHGDPGMATAGAGDVLTGIIASLLAQGKAPLDAALLGVTLHGLSGEIAASKKTSYGFTAIDLIDNLPDAFSYFLE